MPRALREPHATQAAGANRGAEPGRGGFTLVELLVVLVIVMILSGLMLAGLATARQRIKIDSTRNTIRKIHEIVMPQYESYLRRRVPMASPGARLEATRLLMVYELPDSWGDVLNGMPGVIAAGATWPFIQTGPVMAYATTKFQLMQSGRPFAEANWSAECLYMIVSYGSGEPDAMERFRTDEIGDTDNDGAPEFLDAWRQPIGFIRWAPGASSPLAPGVAGLNSPVQVGDPGRFHDPLDAMGVDPNGFLLVPLIFSSGPDRTSGLVTTGTGGWLTDANAGNVSMPAIDGRMLASIAGQNCRFNAAAGFSFADPNVRVSGMADATAAAKSWADNVTNHDLIKK